MTTRSLFSPSATPSPDAELSAAHLASCAECSAELADLRRTVSLGRSSRDVELLAPPGRYGRTSALSSGRSRHRRARVGFGSRLRFAALSAPRLPPHPSPTDRRRPSTRVARWWPYAAAALVVGILAGVAGAVLWPGPSADVIAEAALDPFPTWDASGTAQPRESRSVRNARPRRRPRRADRQRSARGVADGPGHQRARQPRPALRIERAVHGAERHRRRSSSRWSISPRSRPTETPRTPATRSSAASCASPDGVGVGVGVGVGAALTRLRRRSPAGLRRRARRLRPIAVRAPVRSRRAPPGRTCPAGRLPHARRPPPRAARARARRW